MNRRAFCGLSIAALAGGRGTSGAEQVPVRRPAVGATRWPAALSEGDFYGMGADFAEIREIEPRIKTGDLDSYLKAWMDMAQGVEAKGEAFEKAGRPISAHEAYLRASNYYQRAYMGLLRAGDAARIVAPYARVREAWKKAWKLVPPPFEEVAIPYQGDDAARVVRSRGPLRPPARAGGSVYRRVRPPQRAILPAVRAAQGH